jgi:hypothetical protein
VKSRVTIIHAAGELDENGVWQDTNGDGNFDVFLWVKNIGSVTIDNPENGDLFIGGTDIDWTRIPHADWAGGLLPSWDDTVENGTDWSQTETLAIEVSFETPLSAGEYSIRLIIPNGVSDEYYFSM